MAALIDQRELSASADSPSVWLEPVRFHHMLLDGTWWPGSGDLTAELPVLVPALERLCGPVSRLLLGVAGWTTRPHEVTIPGFEVAGVDVAGREVSVSYQAGQSPSLATAHCTDGHTLTLFVQPPGSERD